MPVRSRTFVASRTFAASRRSVPPPRTVPTVRLRPVFAGLAACLAAALVLGAAPAAARQAPGADAFVSVPAGSVALTGVRLVDGTGGPVRDG